MKTPANHRHFTEDFRTAERRHTTVIWTGGADAQAHEPVHVLTVKAFFLK